MKLYFSPGACSLAPHIVMLELGLKHELVKVDLRAKTYNGGDYWKINPKGSVPAIGLDSGEVLTEAAVLLQYLSDLKPDAGLFPKAGGLERVRAQVWLHYVSTEIHKAFGMLFAADRLVKNPEGNQELKASASEALRGKFAHLAGHLSEHAYLLGENFSIADAYLFTCLRWAGTKGIDLAQFPALKKYFERVQSRPQVRAALEIEGLKPV